MLSVHLFMLGDEMMTWNHRIIRRVHHHSDGTTSESFMVHEVYYDDAGRPVSCTEEGVEPYGETLEELVEELKMFSQAAGMPILEYDQFIGQPEKGL